jgi:hypothetical protein
VSSYTTSHHETRLIDHIRLLRLVSGWPLLQQSELPLIVFSALRVPTSFRPLLHSGRTMSRRQERLSESTPLFLLLKVLRSIIPCGISSNRNPGLINTFGVHLLKYINNVSVFWHAAGTTSLIIAILAKVSALEGFRYMRSLSKSSGTASSERVVCVHSVYRWNWRRRRRLESTGEQGLCRRDRYPHGAIHSDWIRRQCSRKSSPF